MTDDIKKQIRAYTEKTLQIALLDSKKVYERTYTSSVEISRANKSRAQLKELDKYLKKQEITRHNYTGLVGRRLCFAFDTEEERSKFEREFAELLKERKVEFKYNR
ncbi:MAG: hypothetical protein ACOVOV_02580 [Dolichospermum sp.]